MVSSNQPSGEAQIINFPRMNDDAQPTVRPISEVYTPLMVDFYSELGVPDQFLAMMGRYLMDTKVSSSSQELETVQEVVKARKVGGEGEFTWQRQTRLSLKHINMLSDTICRVLDKMDVREKSDKSPPAKISSLNGQSKAGTASRVSVRTRTLKTIATNMAFLETTADVLGSCVYMQHRYDHYIPDFNGSYFKAHDKVSRDFWDFYAYKSGEKEHEAAITQDHRNLRSGVAILFLTDDLLRYEIVETITEAQWVTRAVANNYPTPRRYKELDSPMSEEDIRQRCLSLYVRPDALLEYSKII